jgi:hypothetical protein
MDTQYKPFIVRWENGTFSFFIGTGTYDVHDTMDEQGDTRGAEARAIPGKYHGFICLDQNDVGEKFSLLGCEHFSTIEELWDLCKKRLFPEDDEQT